MSAGITAKVIKACHSLDEAAPVHHHDKPHLYFYVSITSSDSAEGAGEQRRSIVNVSPPTVEEDGPSYSRRDNMMSFPAPVTVELLGTGCVMNQSGWIRVLESLGAMGGR